MKEKMLVIGFVISLLIGIVTVNSVYADNNKGGGKGGNPPPCIPEPVSMLLLLASGGTYAGIRYLRARRNSKKLNETNTNNPS